MMDFSGNCCFTRAIWKDEEEAGKPQKGTTKNCYPSAGRRLIKMLFSRHCDIFLFYIFHRILFKTFIVSRQFSSTLPSRLASARPDSGCCWRSSLCPQCSFLGRSFSDTCSSSWSGEVQQWCPIHPIRLQSHRIRQSIQLHSIEQEEEEQL